MDEDPAPEQSTVRGSSHGSRTKRRIVKNKKPLGIIPSGFIGPFLTILSGTLNSPNVPEKGMGTLKRFGFSKNHPNVLFL